MVKFVKKLVWQTPFTKTAMEEVAQVKEMLDLLENFSPTIPPEVVEFYLHQSGFSTNDPRVIKLICLVAHKFIVDVAHDAMQYQQIRTQSSSSVSSLASSSSLHGNSVGNNAAGNRTVLTMEDLACSLKEYGINICKPEYFSDTSS